MKRILLAMMLATASFFIACDNQPAGNASKNTANNSTGNTGTATAPANTAAAEADVKKMMADFEAALNKGDAAALDKMYADDYTLIDQNGVTQTKAQRVDAIKSGKLKFDGLKFSDLKVNMHPAGDGAIITGKVTGKGIMDGKTEERNSMVTWVAAKGKDGSWRFVHAQITDIKDGAAKAEDKGKTDDSGKKEDDKPGEANKAPAANTAPANK